MKKILALALALVLALSMGVTAFADVNYYDYIVAGGVNEPEIDVYTGFAGWDVFQDDEDEYCRVAVQATVEDFDIRIDPVDIGFALAAAGEWKNWDGWDFDEDEFEVYTKGPITAEWSKEKVTLGTATDDAQVYALAVHQGETLSRGISVWEDAAGDLYVFEPFGHVLTPGWYLYTPAADDIVDGVYYILWLDDGYQNFTDVYLTAAEIDALVAFEEAVEVDVNWTHYLITVYPVNDYGVKVVRGEITFKMIDYTSGRTEKFVSAPLYVDLFHVDVFEDDVDKIAGEKKAIVLDNGEPYDNEFDADDHQHSLLAVDDIINGYDQWIFNEFLPIPDIISAESFDEGVGKSLKITDLDEVFQLEIDKVAEYQPGINFSYDEKVADVVAEAFPDAHFQAINFLHADDCGTIYKSGAKLYVDVDQKALAQKGEDTIYLYKYENGVLVYQDAQPVNYYADDAVACFELAAGEELGEYYICDADLRAASEEENPNTGANDVVGVAVALAVVSLVAAAAVSLKK